MTNEQTIDQARQAVLSAAQKLAWAAERLAHAAHETIPIATISSRLDAAAVPLLAIAKQLQPPRSPQLSSKP